MEKPDYVKRLAEILSSSIQLEEVWINSCEMDGTMIRPIIAALNTTAIHTMKKIAFYATNWNSDEAIEELIIFIATAPKLEECDISG